MKPIRRVRLVVDALALGAVVGAAAVPALVASGRTAIRATEVAFALGALVLGVGLLGWSGSVMVGRGVETAQEHLDGDGDWTERKSRRAMARLGGFGGGLMVGSALVEVIALGP